MFKFEIYDNLRILVRKTNSLTIISWIKNLTDFLRAIKMGSFASLKKEASPRNLEKLVAEGTL